jgi:hypothetical protein
MMRLGSRCRHWLLPYKHPREHAKYAYTAPRYDQPFELDEIAECVGYPLVMKRTKSPGAA